MTTYYSPNIVNRIVESARKKLQKLRGETLTREELCAMFGPFDQGGGSCAENRDAFKEILEEGLLIEQLPGQYRVPPVVDKKTQDRILGKIDSIKRSLQKAADEIEKTVMEEVKKAKGCFPKKIFGVLCKKKRTNGETTTVEKKMPAIMLVSDNNYCTYIVLTPEGLFKCLGASTLSVGGRGLVVRPSWDIKEKHSELWIRYGERALRELLRHRR